MELLWIDGEWEIIVDNNLPWLSGFSLKISLWLFQFEMMNVLLVGRWGRLWRPCFLGVLVVLQIHIISTLG